MDTIIYLHIPKTAGNTFLQFLLPNFDEDLRFDVNEALKYVARLEALQHLPEEQKRNLKLIYGHLPFGVHKCLTQKAKYITLFRHPIDRIVSHYYYVKEQPTHPLYETVTRADMSLRQYVESGISSEIQNGMTRLLCGQAHQDSLRGHDHCGDSEFALAELHLRTHFRGVGVVEQFDRSLALLSSMYGWPMCSPSRKNVTRLRRPVDSIDDETRKSIEFHNRYDMQLYSIALRQFEQECEEFAVPREVRIPATETTPLRKVWRRLRNWI